MKSTSGPQSATSLPRAPRDDAGSRTLRYFIMMTVRVVCFVLMVVITPYGWHTLLLGLGAVFLPYLAVVNANVSHDAQPTAAVSPERALTATVVSEPPPASQVLLIHETPAVTPVATPPAESKTPPAASTPPPPATPPRSAPSNPDGTGAPRPPASGASPFRDETGSAA